MATQKIATGYRPLRTGDQFTRRSYLKLAALLTFSCFVITAIVATASYHVSVGAWPTVVTLLLLWVANRVADDRRRPSRLQSAAAWLVYGTLIVALFGFLVGQLACYLKLSLIVSMVVVSTLAVGLICLASIVHIDLVTEPNGYIVATVMAGVAVFLCPAIMTPLHLEPIKILSWPTLVIIYSSNLAVYTVNRAVAGSRNAYDLAQVLVRPYYHTYQAAGSYLESLND